MQNKWFKLFIWFLTSFIFFLAAGVLISMFSPGPTESDVIKFEAGLMSAMDQSMMGVSMALENNTSLQSIVALSTYMFIPILLISIVAGFAIRRVRRMDKNV